MNKVTRMKTHFFSPEKFDRFCLDPLKSNFTIVTNQYILSLYTIVKIQSVTNTQIRSLNIDAPHNRTDKMEEENLLDLDLGY